jgi:hypothetical protein
VNIIVIWLVFILGQAIHLFLQIDAMVRSSTSPATSRLTVLEAKASTFLARFFVCTMIFWLWFDGQLAAVIQGTGISVPSWVTALIALHISGGWAGLVGFGIDSALAYIPGLKSTLPQDTPPPPPPAGPMPMGTGGAGMISSGPVGAITPPPPKG